MAQASFVLSLRQQPLPSKTPSMGGLRNKTQVKDSQGCESFIDMRRINPIGPCQNLLVDMVYLIWTIQKTS